MAAVQKGWTFEQWMRQMGMPRDWVMSLPEWVCRYVLVIASHRVMGRASVGDEDIAEAVRTKLREAKHYALGYGLPQRHAVKLMCGWPRVTAGTSDAWMENSLVRACSPYPNDFVQNRTGKSSYETMFAWLCRVQRLSQVHLRVLSIVKPELHPAGLVALAESEAGRVVGDIAAECGEARAIGEAEFLLADYTKSAPPVA